MIKYFSKFNNLFGSLIGFTMCTVPEFFFEEMIFKIVLRFFCDCKRGFFCVSFALFQIMGKFVVLVLFTGIFRFDVLDVHLTTK